MDNEDWTYINAILNSSSGDRDKIEKLNYPRVPLLTPESVRQSAPAPRHASIKFDQKFNQNPTTCKHGDKNVSCLTKLKEEDSISLADYFSDEEDKNSLADYFSDEEEEDNLGYKTDQEDTQRTSGTAILGFRQHQGTTDKEEKKITTIKSPPSQSTQDKFF